MVQEDEKAASGENATTFADQDIEEILAHSKVVEHKETQTAEEKDLKVRTHPTPIYPVSWCFKWSEWVGAVCYGMAGQVRRG